MLSRGAGWHTYPEMGAGASMWSTPSDMALFAIDLMSTYTGESGKILSQKMAVEMLTPQIEGRCLGLYVGDDGADRLYFLHSGANDGYKSYLIGYPLKGQGLVIMTNSDNGDALAAEIMNSVSVEYGWLKNYTGLILGIVGVGAFILAGYFIQRKKCRLKIGWFSAMCCG